MAASRTDVPITKFHRVCSRGFTFVSLPNRELAKSLIAFGNLNEGHIDQLRTCSALLNLLGNYTWFAARIAYTKRSCMRRPVVLKVAIMCPPPLLRASEVLLATFDLGAVTTPAEIVG